MKIKNLFVLSLAALSFVACSNEDEPIVPQEGSLVIDLSSVAAVSKADGTEAGIEDESKLQTVWVYAFDSEGAMYGTPQSATVDTDDKTQATLAWQLPVGTYTIAAVSGVTDAYTEVTTTTLPQKVVNLTDNARTKFVMYGSESVTIAKGETANKTIKVARVLAGVKLVNIKTAFAESVPKEYKDAIKTLASIKIVGSKANALLSGVKNTSAGASDDDSMTKATFTENDAVSITSEFATPDYNLSTAARAYACPEDITRITIGVNYGEVLGTRYYSVEKTALAANTMYGLKVTITGIGSKDPETPTPVGTGNYTIQAQNWTTGQLIEGNIEY